MLRVAFLSLIAIVVSRIMAFLGWPWTKYKQDMTVIWCCYRKSPKHRRFILCFGGHFGKWSTLCTFWRRILAPLMVTYHYVKLYVSIIIHLEVININVRNFNFPIGFNSKPHPRWTPNSMTLAPFTTKMKHFGTTRNIYL